MPKVSILIPVFNRKKFIADCIQSALDQTYTDFEIVVVDNASDDGTWEICKNFAAKDKRVKIFRNSSNIGPVHNWLRCVDEANGEIGKFLFSDDLMLRDFLEITVPKLENIKVGFVYTAALIGQNLESAIVHYAAIKQVEIVQSEFYFDMLINNYAKVPISPGAAIFRMKDIRKNLLVNIPTTCNHDFSLNGAGPDVLLFALTAINYKLIVVLSQPLVYFRVHNESFTMATDNNTLSEGYWLALAWFFRFRYPLKKWAAWTAKIWIHRCRDTRTLISPFGIAIRYSGNGSFKDVGQLFVAAIRLLFKKITSYL